jgi:hypothetical protein
MARLSWVQRLYWRYLSKPVAHRALYNYVIENPIASILEIGMGTGDRIRTLLSLYQLSPSAQQLRYAAVDPFESAGSSVPHVSLKGAHRILSENGVKAHLIPGDVMSGISRVAHTVLPSDLVVIDGNWNAQTPESELIERWLPRLCHRNSVIFASKTIGDVLVRVPTPGNAIPGTTVTKAA